MQTLAERGYKARWLGESLQFTLKAFASDYLLQSIGKELLAGPKPEAIFAFNDFDAAFVMDACHAVGLRIPDDVAILGMDNNELVVNALQPKLSSVKLDFERIGYEGAALLDKLMAGAPRTPQTLLIQPRGIAIRESTDTTAVNHPVVRKVLSIMKSRMQESLGVDDLASAVGLSRRTLENAFQKELRRSVHRTLVDLRLRHARHLLQTTDDTVEAIAVDTGFCHAPHLYREFKRWTGQTPRAWRKAFGQKSE
jgi:LacI family transcriptional regulator